MSAGTRPTVLAHSFGERYQLPIPLWLFLVGGAAVVLVSFLLVLRGGDQGPLPDTDARDPGRLHPLAGGLSTIVVLLLAVHGLVGTQEVADSLAPLGFWVLLWIGVPLSCGLLGDWTRQINPFRFLAQVTDRPAVRKAVLARTSPLPWPRRLGWWPAVALFVLLVLGELVFNLDTTVPAFVGSMLLGYALVSAFLGLVYGSTWLERGEVFSGLFDAWGRLGWWRFGAAGRRGFAGGLDAPFDASASRVVFVLLLLVSINFDGLLATPQWASYERHTLGTDSHGIDLLRTASLVGLVLVVLAVFTLFAHAAARAGRLTTTPLASLALLLPSLVPIAFGYLIAHYLEYLVTQSQSGYRILVDPDFEADPTLLPSSFYWYLSVVVIVAAHVVAVVLSHRQLAARISDRALVRRAELPWLVAMVGYTAFSLFLIAQPLTEAASGG